MTKKYVRLSDDHTEIKSATFSVKPKQIRRLPDEVIPEHNWFTVVEHRAILPDRELYHHRRASWELIDDVVHMHYEPVLIGLDERREIIVARCQEFRDDRLGAGIVFNGKLIDTRLETKLRVSGLVIKAMQDSTFTSNFITEDNSIVTFNAQDIIAFGDAFAQFEAEQIFYGRQLKDQIMASDEPETIDYTAGWPSIEFGTT